MQTIDGLQVLTTDVEKSNRRLQRIGKVDNWEFRPDLDVANREPFSNANFYID